MTQPIVCLSDYNLNWENEFEYERKRIVEVIGDNCNISKMRSFNGAFNFRSR
jgi:hypothetical protein